MVQSNPDRNTTTRSPAEEVRSTEVTERTAQQQAAGTSPTTDDATARAERAVDDDSAPFRRGRAASHDDHQALTDRVAALEEDFRKLRAQLRHSL